MGKLYPEARKLLKNYLNNMKVEFKVDLTQIVAMLVALYMVQATTIQILVAILILIAFQTKQSTPESKGGAD